MVGATKIFVDGAIYRPCRVGSTDCSVQMMDQFEVLCWEFGFIGRVEELHTAVKEGRNSSSRGGEVPAIFQNGLAWGVVCPERGAF